jgi:hypothetical protein
MEFEPAELSEIAPDFAAIVKAALDEQGDEHLAQQLSALNVVAMCGCGDEFCGSFYTTAPPEGAWPPSSDTVLVEGETPGMMVVLDVVDGEIAYVEVIDEPELRRRLHSAGIPLAPRVGDRRWDVEGPPDEAKRPDGVVVTDQHVVVESDATWSCATATIRSGEGCERGSVNSESIRRRRFLSIPMKRDRQRLLQRGRSGYC